MDSIFRGKSSDTILDYHVIRERIIRDVKKTEIKDLNKQGRLDLF